MADRREIEQQLHREREFVRRLVDSFPDVIVVLDTEGRYTFVSPRIRETLGYEPEELVGRVMGERTNLEDRSALLELFRELVSGDRPFGMIEYRTRHKNGSWRLFRATARPLKDPDGKIAGVIASARDITEQKQREQQLLQSEKLAALGQMIAGVAHELNNPLTAILGVTDLLRERASDEAARRQLDLVHQQARRAAEIVQNLLIFSQPQAPRKGLLNLNDVVRRVLRLHESSLEANNVAVDFVLESKLPLALGDPNQLMQVLLNMVINAEQAISEARGRGTLPRDARGTLRIRLGQRDDKLWVSFQDNGPGIPSEILPRIFDPFFTTKRPGRSTGLGLSICLAIVREHQGTIDVHAPVGQGATFTVTLPVARPERTAAGREAKPPEEKPAEAAPGAAQAGTEGLSGRAVLVVDDEESITELVRDGLTARHVDVDCAHDGEQAMALAARRSYDAILCDFKMPGLSGQGLFERMRAQEPEIERRFIFMTGDLVDPATQEFLKQSGVRTLQKPFTMDDLLKVVRQTLGSRGPATPHDPAS